MTWSSASRLASWSMDTLVSPVASKLYQLCASQFLKHGERRVLGCDHRFRRDKKGLLQRVLSAEHGVRHHVGVDHPARPGRELVVVFRAGALKRGVLLEEVVKAHHE